MNERPFYPNLIIVGGTGRNSGKTSFVCGLIEKFRDELCITGLKVSSIYANEMAFHGYHDKFEDKDIQIFRETNTGSAKDTSRMLQSGADEAWFLSVTDDNIGEGISRFWELKMKDSVIICESNSLAKIVKPGLFVMIRRNDQQPFKARVTDLQEYADLLIDFDDGPFAPMIDKIKFNEQGWFVDE